MRVALGCPNDCTFEYGKRYTYAHWKYCPKCAAELVEYHNRRKPSPEQQCTCPLDGCERTFILPQYLYSHLLLKHKLEPEKAKRIRRAVEQSQGWQV